MGFRKKSSSSSNSSSSRDPNSSISGLQDLENLTLTTHPWRTLKFFGFAIYDYVRQSIAYILAKGGWLLFSSLLVLFCGVVLATIEGSHEKHVQEVLRYLQFVLWWTALGIGSSIGLGSGLHTFLLYLGPHIAVFTIKAMECGRVDLKSAPYDTKQLKQAPSWLDKDCSEFGPPLFNSVYGPRVPFTSILPQIQLEAVLWGIGTALGELPPYFISRAARLSGSKLNPMEESDADSLETRGLYDRVLKPMKVWFLAHSQYLNVWTILLLASVPNPLFDMAGIMCGQFGIPFWQFFCATLFGKAVIKTHIQTILIISICNNQLLDFLENKFIRVLSYIPGVAPVLPALIAKLHAAKDKYLVTTPPVTQVNKWGLSVASIWNTFVWLVLLKFFIKIVNSTAQSYLKKEQEKELKQGN